MKSIGVLKMLGVIVCVAVASDAYAQASDAMATSDTAVPALNAKAVKKADRKLARDVRRALSKARGFDGSNVFVRARSGAVTLTGTVLQNTQIAQATAVAKGVPGVKSVSNKITLTAQGGGG
jgi:hyperosmotically inducible periplasmic protein